MDELKIIENVSPTDVEIIKDYWSLTEDGTLARKPNKLAQKLGIPLYDLKKLVRENSEYIIEMGNCKGCSTPLKETVTSHTAFNAAKITKERECEQCAEITEQKRMEERRVLFERDRERTLELARIRDAQEENLKAEIKEISPNPDKAFELQAKHNLSLEELKTFILILKYKSKDQIYSKVFNGDPQKIGQFGPL